MNQTDQINPADTSKQLKRIVSTSLFVSLITVGAFIFIPIGPVPIVLQNMFILLAGVILGPVWGLACVAIYLFIGFAGLPVFSGGTSGIGKLFGPTGGFLIGYLPCVYVTGLIADRFGKKMATDIIAMIAGSVLIYTAGIPWLMKITGMGVYKALAVGCYPFLIPDLIKIIAAAFIAKAIRPVIKL